MSPDSEQWTQLRIEPQHARAANGLLGPASRKQEVSSGRVVAHSGPRVDFIADGIESYHSKYNPVERCWSCLERHWNGTLLTDVNTALQCTDKRCSSALPKVCSEPTAPHYGRADVEWVCW